MAIAITGLPAVARTQPTQGANETKAFALFNEGRDLADAGRYADACPKFVESLRLVRGIGTEFHLADCWEHVGLTASAWALFQTAASEATAAKQAERVQVLRSRVNALEPKLSRLVIEVAREAFAGAPELVVIRDGALLGRALWGVSVPVDPGNHLIAARAPGKRSWSTRITVPASAGQYTVNVPMLSDNPNVKGTGEVQEQSRGVAVTEPVDGDQSPGDSPTVAAAPPGRTIALVLGGVGFVALGVGTGFYLQYRSKNGDADNICPPGTPTSQCPIGSRAHHEELLSSARTARTWTYLGWGAGAVALGAATTLYLVSGQEGRTAHSSQPRFALTFVAAGAGVQAECRW